MTPVTLFQKYLWLLSTLVSNGSLTFKEINDLWSKSSINCDKEESIPRRTFFRMKNAIESIFDVIIDYNPQTRRYGLSGDMPDKSLSEWMLETMSVSNFILSNKELKDRIIIEESPSAASNLSVIIQAMKSCNIISFSHHSFFKDNPKKEEVEPLCIKSFRRRWYMLGKTRKGNDISIYPLDRIYDLKETDLRFTMPKDFNAERYFKDYYGVLMDKKPEKILLWTTSLRAKYIRTLPLHHSQKEIETVRETSTLENNGHSLFEYYVAPTFDFIQELRSLGPEVKVIEPQYLADILRRNALQVADLYENNH